MKQMWLFGLSLLMAAAPSQAAWTIKEVSLPVGRDPERNVLNGPVFDGTAADPVRFRTLTSNIDADTPVLRFPKKNGKVKNHKYRYSPLLDLGAVLTRSMRYEAAEMGLESGDGAESSGWTVDGSIEDLYFHYSVVMFGPILFYGTMDLSLVAEHVDGRHVEFELALYDMDQRYNGGFGAGDEVAEALATFMVNAAQEVIAHLNRQAFRAPPHDGVKRLLNILEPGQLEDQAVALRRIGLSGIPEAAPELLSLLRAEQDSDGRVEVVNALANLGVARDIGAALAERYGGEDEDVRFFTLKALAYLNAPELGPLADRWSKIERKPTIRRLALSLTSD